MDQTAEDAHRGYEKEREKKRRREEGPAAGWLQLNPKIAYSSYNKRVEKSPYMSQEEYEQVKAAGGVDAHGAGGVEAGLSYGGAGAPSQRALDRMTKELDARKRRTEQAHRDLRALARRRHLHHEAPKVLDERRVHVHEQGDAPPGSSSSARSPNGQHGQHGHHGHRRKNKKGRAPTV